MNQEDNKIQEDNAAERIIETTFDPTSLFEPDKTKKLIFRETPKVAKLSQQNVRLIDTTAALFLQNLVSTVSSSKTSDCITMQDLSSTISSTESLHFLKPAFDTIQQSKRAEMPYVPKKKAKRQSTTSTEQTNEKIQKAKSFLGKHQRDEETVSIALDVSNNEIDENAAGPTNEIVPDEDDYD